MQAEINAIPPVGTDFTILDDAEFLDETEPVVTLLAGSTGAVLDTERLSLIVEAVALHQTGEFQIYYQCSTVAGPAHEAFVTGTPLSVRDYVVGVGGAEVTSPRFLTRALTASDRQRVTGRVSGDAAVVISSVVASDDLFAEMRTVVRLSTGSA